MLRRYNAVCLASVVAVKLHDVEGPYIVGSDDCVRDDDGGDDDGEDDGDDEKMAVVVHRESGIFFDASQQQGGGGERNWKCPPQSVVEQTGGPDSSLDMRSGVDIGFQS